MRAAQHLLLETGHGSAEGPWLPIGAGVHTGTAFVGIVSRGTSSDFTAFGDPINVAAHVAAQAAPGEILVTSVTADAAKVATDGARTAASLAQGPSGRRARDAGAVGASPR